MGLALLPFFSFRGTPHQLAVKQRGGGDWRRARLVSGRKGNYDSRSICPIQAVRQRVRDGYRMLQLSRSMVAAITKLKQMMSTTRSAPSTEHHVRRGSAACSLGCTLSFERTVMLLWLSMSLNTAGQSSLAGSMPETCCLVSLLCAMAWAVGTIP